MSAVAFAFTMLTTVYCIAGPDNVPFVVLDKATKGSHLAYKLIKEAHGGSDLILVSPFLLTSTDDFNTFIFKGTADESCNQKLMIVSNSSISGMGSSQYIQQGRVNKEQEWLKSEAWYHRYGSWSECPSLYCDFRTHRDRHAITEYTGWCADIGDSKAICWRYG